MAPYRRGLEYFHGGASLQEAVVPILTIKLETTLIQAETTVSLDYKNGLTKIRTRMPVFDIRLDAEDLLAQAENFEVRLEAQDPNGEVVGDVKLGDFVNAATGSITLQPNEPIRATLRMDDDFSGKFSVKAINPRTEAIYVELGMETDYVI